MRRFVSLLLVLLSVCSVSSAAQLDFSTFSDGEIMQIHEAALREIQKRGLVKSANVPVGTYIVGVDFPAGVYSVKAHSYVCAVEVYNPNSDRPVFDASCYQDELGIGKLELKDGQRLVIEVAGAVFSEYIGISFN